MFINPEYSESEYPALRQYAHRVLYASTTLPDLSNAPQSVVSKWQGLEYGLAYYFPAGYRNDSKLQAISMTTGGLLNNDTSFQTVASAQIGQRELAQRAWGGTLWEIRSKFGKEAVDRCVYRAWCELKPENLAEVDRNFIGNLLTHIREFAGRGAEHVVREILISRGFDAEFLRSEAIASG